MSTKKNKNKELDANEMALAQRMQAIKDFNMNNMGEQWIDPERIPTDEEKKQAKEEFEAMVKELQQPKDYLIADKDNALRVAKFLMDFNRNAFWMQRSWVGIINFDTQIQKFIEECETEPKDLTLDYGAMQFCYSILENYAGIGYESAKRMFEIWDEYVPIYDLLRGYVEEYKAKNEEAGKLQQHWALMEQGFYHVILNKNNGEETAEVEVTETPENKETVDVTE